MMTQLVECVPNFSEGRDLKVIERIISSIVSVSGIKLLDTFTGAETNRTVITFAGTPGDVVEAAYRSIETASLYIDMSKQKGLHPRMGATDVCPFIPLSGISMEDTVQYARLLAERV
ncbi:MAG: glutamate formimidoyltransferase, partial [Bacteroidales bacterium]|nr:glutamate formimidoyltransferase [Bacteroidales bacterium]